MDQNALARNGIVFEEEPSKVELHAPHVFALRGALLDFDWTIPDRLSISEDESFRNLAGIFYGLDISAFERKEIEKSLAVYKNLREEAQKLDEGGDREAEWQGFFRDFFFRPFTEEMKVADGDSRR